MYKDFFEFWKKEKESTELGKLPPDFYFQVSEYVKRLKEEERMIDRKTLKASLLKVEMRNVRRIVHGLVKVRYQKLVRFLMEGRKVSLDALAVQERDIIKEGILSLAEMFQNLAEDALRGHLTEKVEKTQKRFAVRFLKEVPAIIGADMKAYGPFKCEDVASLPIENVKILIKQKLAEKIEA